jgi:hypothetical protein
MVEPPGGFVPYNLSYSDRVRDELATTFEQARILGQHVPLAAAAKALDSRLRIYPQFGEPLRDTVDNSGREYFGIIPPLVARYLVYEERRLVLVVYPIRVLRGSGF